MSTKTKAKFHRALSRAVLRSELVSLFWSIYSDRKRNNGLTLAALAKEVGGDKARLSREFNGDPNWTTNTIASLADALDVELQIKAVDKRNAGVEFTAAGKFQTQAKRRSDATMTDAPQRGAQLIFRSPIENLPTSVADQTSTSEAA